MMMIIIMYVHIAQHSTVHMLLVPVHVSCELQICTWYMLALIFHVQFQVPMYGALKLRCNLPRQRQCRPDIAITAKPS